MADTPQPRPGAVLRDRSLLLVLLGLLALFVPSYVDFLYGPWASESRGHELLLLAVTAWLFHRKADELAALPSQTPASGIALLVLGLLAYVFGRTQQYLRIELIALVLVLAATLVCFKGWRALRPVWFAFFLLLFIVPLPYSLVIKLTGPLQAAVSLVAAKLMSWVGYPAGRSGVVITVGQYQLLVAEACAGLHTMFTLEAMGLLYTYLMNYRSWVRNACLAVLVLPVSFVANVVRVVILCLVTYHLGDAVGQGAVHGLAGLVLFAVALALIGSLDRLLGAVLPARFAA
jgi:exosortase B